MLESKIQRKIIEHFEKEGWLVVKYLQTTKNGWPDLGLHKNKVVVYCEVKQPGKVCDDLQLYRHQELRKQGFKVIVATSVNEAVAQI